LLSPFKQSKKNAQTENGERIKTEEETSNLKHRVRFSEVVEVVNIPSHTEYSNRIKLQYWSDAKEISEMAYRNFLEFESEGWNWENVLEEDEMIFCQETGGLVHPIHFDMSETEQPTI